MERREQEEFLKRVQSTVQETLGIQERFFAENLDSLREAFDEVVGVLRTGGKLLIIGNGGSAADAQHVACELVNRYQVDRPSLPAIALTTDPSILSDIGNDSDYRYVFSEIPHLITMLERHPDRFKELQELENQGKTEMVNAFVVEPTVCLSGGEALVMQGVEGLRWYKQVIKDGGFEF